MASEDIESKVEAELCNFKSIGVYKNWWSRYDFFLKDTNNIALGNDIKMMRNYILSLHEDGTAPSTLWQCISALSKRCEINGSQRLSSDAVMKSLMKKWSKEYQVRKSKTLSLIDFQSYFSAENVDICKKKLLLLLASSARYESVNW